MKITIFYFIIIIVFLGCTEKESITSPKTTADYLVPLAVGNQWTYSFEVFDSTGKDLNSFQKVSSRILRDSLTNTDHWYWIDPEGWVSNRSDGYWVYLPGYSPFLQFPFPTDDHVSYTLPTAGILSIISTHDTIFTAAGRFVCRIYLIDYGYYKERHYLAPNIGKIRSEYEIPTASGTWYVYIKQTLFSYSLY